MRRRLHYILDGKIPKLVEDYSEWLKLFDYENRIVKRTELPGDILISTVFLGVDHAFGEEEPAVLFETMIFGGKYDQYQERYHTWEEAEQGHQKAIDLIYSV